MDRVLEYFKSKGNITGFLPRWVFLVIGILMMVYQTIYYSALKSLILTGLAIVVFFVLDYFAPRIIPWVRERTQNATAKLERENLK